jgi:AcrR family transcriptional regulator
MEARGMGPSDLAAKAGISRGQVYRVIKDLENVTDRSYGACESALDRIEHEHGHGGPDALLSTEAGLIEFGVDVDAIGVHVVVKGPIANAAELEASVARLIRDIRDSGEAGRRRPESDLPDS